MPAEGTIRRELFIEAAPATVFAFLTDPVKMARWMGLQCELDPRPGGLYLVNLDGINTARGTFEEVVPNSRVVFTFGWDEAPEGGVRPGSSRVAIELVAKDRGTQLIFVHSGLPEDAVAPHTDGWTHYLGRLVLAAGGTDPGPDPRAKAA